MTLDKERFEFYRKWLKTLLVKEFLNLNLKQQEQFLIMIAKFLKDCRKVHDDAKKIMEKIIEISVTGILSPDNKTEDYIIVGRTVESSEDIKIGYPSSIKKPSIGDILTHTVYSVDGEIWYSSKEELITGRKK